MFSLSKLPHCLRHALRRMVECHCQHRTIEQHPHSLTRPEIRLYGDKYPTLARIVEFQERVRSAKDRFARHEFHDEVVQDLYLFVCLEPFWHRLHTDGDCFNRNDLLPRSIAQKRAHYVITGGDVPRGNCYFCCAPIGEASLTDRQKWLRNPLFTEINHRLRLFRQSAQIPVVQIRLQDLTLYDEQGLEADALRRGSRQGCIHPESRIFVEDLNLLFGQRSLIYA